jgi:hypothetical protein
MNTCSARKYSIFAPAQLSRNWRLQPISNQDDLDSSVTGEAGRDGNKLAFDFIFVP